MVAGALPAFGHALASSTDTSERVDDLRYSMLEVSTCGNFHALIQLYLIASRDLVLSRNWLMTTGAGLFSNGKK